MKLRQENYAELVAFVTACVKNYLEYASPATVGISATVAGDLIETRPTWKAADFVMCFKFIRQNAGKPLPKNSDPNCIVREDKVEDLKVLGNTITGTRIMEMVSVYEAQRAIEIEKMQNEKKGEHMRPTLRTHGESDVKKLMGNLADEAAARQEQLRQSGKLKQDKQAPDENYFKREHNAA